jgi:hypothetical protein
MPDRPFLVYNQPLPEPGDVVIARDEGGDDWLVLLSGRVRKETLEPLEKKNWGMAQRFAEIATPQQALDFCRRYGLLGFPPPGSPRQLVKRTDPLSCEGRPVLVWCRREPLSLWLEAAQTMRWMLDLWGAIEVDDDDAMSLLVRREVPEGAARGLRVSPGGFLADKELDADLFPAGNADTWFAHADEYRDIPAQVLADVMNRALYGVSPLVAADDERTLSFHLRPRNLWAGMVVQVAQSASGGVTFRKCARPGCGEYFPVTPLVARTNKRYCSDVCKSAAYRVRRAGKPRGAEES